MSKIKQIELEFNCPKRLDTMNSSQKGFNCDDCSNEVIDFRERTNSELQEIISNSLNPVCGVFKRSQLSSKFMGYAAATFIATASSLSANAQEPIQTDSLEIAIDSLEQEEHEIFIGTIVEYQAEPIGGYQKFMETIANSLKFPPELDEEGRVFIQFTVDTLGQTGEFKVVRGFNEIADKAALELMKNLNVPFNPAKQRGTPVKTRLVMPVTLQI